MIDLPELKWFDYENFACRCGCEDNQIDLDLIVELDLLRDVLGFPIIVTSGYRCVNHPDEIKKQSGPGPHTTGLAVDLALSRTKGFQFMELAFTRKSFTGVGWNQKGSGRFIHVDRCPHIEGVRPRSSIWSY